MADTEAAGNIYNPLPGTVKRGSGNPGSWKLLTRSAMGMGLSQEPDPELGAGGAPARAVATQSGCPRLATFLDSEDVPMVYRRFATLHSRVLLQQQDELLRLEQQFQEVDRDDDGVLRARCRKSASWLVKAMEENLSAYGE